jgi:TonB family protein
MDTPMLALRLSCLFLTLAALPALSQEAPTPAAPPAGTGVQTPATTPPEKPPQLGSDVIPPKVIHHVEAEFSDEARRKKISGNVRVYLWVEKDGKPSHIAVIQSAGHGLDEQAVEAVRQYKFKPATLNGEPVVVDLYVEVRFQIFDKKH